MILRISHLHKLFLLIILAVLEGIYPTYHIANPSICLLSLYRNGDLILYYTNGEAPAVLRRVPWFLEREKRITSLSFHPAGSWLLVTGTGFLQ